MERENKRPRGNEDKQDLINTQLSSELLLMILKDWCLAWRPVTFWVCKYWARLLTRWARYSEEHRVEDYGEPGIEDYIHEFHRLLVGGRHMLFDSAYKTRATLLQYISWTAALNGNTPLYEWVHHISYIESREEKGHFGGHREVTVIVVHTTPHVLFALARTGNAAMLHRLISKGMLNVVEHVRSLKFASLFGDKKVLRVAIESGHWNFIKELRGYLDDEDYETLKPTGAALWRGMCRTIAREGNPKAIKTCVWVYEVGPRDNDIVLGPIAKGALIGAGNVKTLQYIEEKYRPRFDSNALQEFWLTSLGAVSCAKCPAAVASALRNQRWLQRHWNIDSEGYKFDYMACSFQMGSLQGIWACLQGVGIDDHAEWDSTRGFNHGSGTVTTLRFVNTVLEVLFQHEDHKIVRGVDVVKEADALFYGASDIFLEFHVDVLGAAIDAIKTKVWVTIAAKRHAPKD